jgi:signal transduction histidine kinase
MHSFSLKKSGYRTKLLLAILAISLPLFLISDIDEWIAMQRFGYNLLIDRVNSTSDFLVNTIRNNLINGYPREAPDIANLPHVAWAVILDNNGIVRYSTAPRLAGLKDPIKDIDDFQEFKSGLVVRSIALRLIDRPWKLQFGYSTHTMIVDLRNAFYRALVFDVGICFMVLFLSWIVTGFLQKPLLELKKNTLRMAGGDFSVSMKVTSKDIIGELAQAFNAMAHEVHDLTENLEQKITDATGQLSIKNQELEASYAKLVELDNFRSDFLAMLSHDLKSPLVSIIGFAQTLDTLNLPKEEQRRYLGIIKEEGRRLASRVEGILDIYKLESNKFPLVLGAVHPTELISNALNGFKEQSSMKIERHLQEDLPLIRGDKDMLMRVLANILENAIKYCDNHGTLEITAMDKHNGVAITIKDSGPGIPMEDKDKIFDKFYRSDAAVKGKKRGSGLGLAIVKSIIEAHGGSVWCESDIGKGMTIGFWLPKCNVQDSQTALCEIINPPSHLTPAV